ncbi:MAG: DNA translocase FtsK 4TM domain-containing protein [Kiloniellales bacterium]|nr:DNA translocase FtsK 4TM domain-containing protein [Kiloniellales bacterium]
MELLGLVLALVALGLVLALSSYDPNDPSLNRASDGLPRNLLGRDGAAIADGLLQYSGVASMVLPLAFGAWAWRALRDRAWPRWWLRIILVPAVVVFAGAALAALPKPGSWPLESSLGGALGQMLLERLAAFPSVEPWMAATGSAGLAGLLLLYTLGLSAGEWQGLLLGPLRLFGPLLRPRAGEPARSGGPMRRRAARSEPRAEPKAAPAAKAPKKKKRQKANGARQEPQLVAQGNGADLEEEDTVLLENELPPLPKALTEGADLVAAPAPRTKPSKQAEKANQRRFEFASAGDYESPPLSLLANPPADAAHGAVNRDALEKNARLLETVLQDFGVRGEIVKVRPGPVVTRYELAPAPGTKTSRVVGLADDIARSMSAISVRVAVVPGSNVIGIELPNSKRETVYLRELLGSQGFERAGGKLPLILGKDISGMAQIVDLARMPHLLIAGTTGSGKSVSLNAMILSLLYRLPPEKCRFIMVDPKMLELSVYDDIPHLLSPVVTEPKKAIVALKWTVREMENRYRAMSQLGVRNIDGYNARVEEARRRGEVLTRKIQVGFDPDTGNPLHEDQPIDLQPLPYIVVVIDEMADLMLVAGKDVEAAVQRLSQMARAAGIHLMMATQRPSVDVITGTIKANFPTRISFHVTSKIDSRTILGEMGAEQLLGQGDMLYMAQGGRITRVHGPLVTDQEVEDVVAHLKAQGLPDYIEAITEDEEPELNGFGGEANGSGDDLYDRAVALVCSERKASTSFVQRHLQIGYNRAARLIERMESEGVIGPANHVGKREVLGRNLDEA